MANSKDVKMLVELGLKRNPEVRALVSAYEELAEEDKALFKLAVEYGQATADNMVEDRRQPSKELDSGTGHGQIQPLVRRLMKTLLEDYPTLLDDTDIHDLTNRDYCLKTLGFQLGGFPLLRRIEAGRKGSSNDRRDRYYVKLYRGRFYVCSQWWKDDHLSNARVLLRFVTQLVERNPNHPGVPALEHNKQALQNYVGIAG